MPNEAAEARRRQKLEDEAFRRANALAASKQRRAMMSNAAVRPAGNVARSVGDGLDADRVAKAMQKRQLKALKRRLAQERSL